MAHKNKWTHRVNPGAIADAIAARYGSLNAASRERKIPVTTLFKLRRPGADPKTSTLVLLALALGEDVDVTVRRMMVFNGTEIEPVDVSLNGRAHRDGKGPGPPTLAHTRARY